MSAKADANPACKTRERVLTQEKIRMENNKSNHKLSWGTRIAYGSGDVACNVVFGMVATVLTLFYTDYAGVSVASVGLVLLISRMFDGVSDVIMGFIVEKTHSKWGKSRPWILWMSVPFAISAVLLFTVPHTTELLQFIYMLVTYNFCTTVCYTAINLPYGSLSTMMTRLSEERDMLSIVRMGMSPVGKIIAVSLTLPLVKLFGDDQMAWVKTMSIWAGIALVLLIFCFVKCEETVEIKAKEKQGKIPVGKSLAALAVNQYFWAALILWMMQNVIFCVTGTILPYYCKYIFNNSTWLYSTLFLLEIGIMIFSTIFCPALVRRYGKRNIALWGAVLAMAGQLVFLINPYSLPWMFMSCITRGVGLAPLNAVIFGILGDVVEFGQWKTHIRQESLIFAGGSLGAKVGSGVAAAIITTLLSIAGYISSSADGSVRPGSALQMIIDIYKFGPIIVWVIVIVVLAFYQLDKKYPKIVTELAEREAKGEL